MATFAKPYIYVPTPPRLKSTAARRRPALEQVSILDKLQHIKSNSTLLNTSQPVVSAADSGRGCRPGIRGTSTICGGSDKENDDDRGLPTIEELLYTKLQEQGFTTEDQGPDKTDGVKEVASEERGGSVDQSSSAQSDNLGRSLDDPIVLLVDDDASAFEAEVGDISLRAEITVSDGGLFDGPENAVASTILAPSPDGWYDIDDFTKTTPQLQLSEQGASTPNSFHPHTPSSRLSGEPLHDSISTEGSRRARSEAATSSSPPPRSARASPETRLSQEGHLHTSQGVADEYELVDHALGTLIDKGARKQQEVEQEKEKGNSEDEDEGPQQEINVVAPVVVAERASGSPRPANLRQSLPNLDPSPEPNHNKAGSRSDSDSDDELNSTDSAKDDEKKQRPAKRKQLSSCDGPTYKKRRRPLQQRSTHQHRPPSKLHGRSPKSHFPLDQGSTVAAVSSAKGRLPSPAPSLLQVTDTDMSPDHRSLDRSTLPTLTEVTFRPHSQHCYSFTAVIREGYNGRGVSFSQVAQLIESIGHIGKIDDFTIKPLEQHSFLLTGFSRHTPSRLSPSGTDISTAAGAGRKYVNATRTRPRHGRAIQAGALASQGSEPASSDSDESGLSSSDPDVSSDDDGCSSEAEKQGSFSIRMNTRWDPVDEQRLIAWKKEGKTWDWIFEKFSGRTRSAVRQRWSIVRPRSK